MTEEEKRRQAAYDAANRKWPLPLSKSGGAGAEPLPGEEMRKMFERDYTKNPDRVFKLEKDIVIPAGTVFARAPWERGGLGNVEGVVGLGKHATAYLNLPLRVAEIDAKEWFTETLEVKKEEEAWFEETTDEK